MFVWPLFGVLLLVGVPIWLVMGSTALLAFALEGQPLLPVAQEILDELNSTTLLAVPYFVAAAVFMERGNVARCPDRCSRGLGRRHSRWARPGLRRVLYHLRGDVRLLRRHRHGDGHRPGAGDAPAGYERHFAAGIVAASGTLGILIPPSLAFVVYGVLADEAITRLFLAGVLPGLLQAAAIGGWVIYYARRKGYAQEARLSREESWKRTIYALPALSVPVIVLGGLYGGFVTMTERRRCRPSWRSCSRSSSIVGSGRTACFRSWRRRCATPRPS